MVSLNILFSLVVAYLLLPRKSKARELLLIFFTLLPFTVGFTVEISFGYLTLFHLFPIHFNNLVRCLSLETRDLNKFFVLEIK